MIIFYYQCLSILFVTIISNHLTNETCIPLNFILTVSLYSRLMYLSLKCEGGVFTGTSMLVSPLIWYFPLLFFFIGRIPPKVVSCCTIVWLVVLIVCSPSLVLSSILSLRTTTDGRTIPDLPLLPCVHTGFDTKTACITIAPPG